MAMNKRRSRFAIGVLLLASVLFGSTMAPAQDLTDTPTMVTFRESETRTTDNSIEISWNVPGSGGSPLQDYQYEYTKVLPAEPTANPALEERLDPDGVHRNNITPVGGTARTQQHVITGLEADQKYAIRMRAQNTNGYGDWSANEADAVANPTVIATYLLVTTAPAPSTGPVNPAAPDKVVFHNETTTTASTIRFTWTTPGSGRSALIDYQLEYMKVGGDTAFRNNFIPPNGLATQSETIGGLEADTRYQIMLRAQNREAGYGPWSEYLYATTKVSDADEETRAPGAPGKVMFRVSDTSATTTSITFSWTTPGSGDSALIDYQLEYEEEGKSTRFTNNIPPVAGSSQQATIPLVGQPPLKVDTDYLIRLRAQNRDQGYGPWSDDLPWSTMAVSAGPPTPAISKMAPPMVEAGDKMLMVSWAEPASEKSITHYHLDYKTASAANWMDRPMNVSALNYPIDGLINGTVYLVRVRGVDSGGNMGVWSDNGSGMPMAGAETPTPTPTPTPALPLFGAFGLGAGLLAAGRARMRRQAQLCGRREQRQMTR